RRWDGAADETAGTEEPYVRARTRGRDTGHVGPVAQPDGNGQRTWVNGTAARRFRAVGTPTAAPASSTRPPSSSTWPPPSAGPPRRTPPRPSSAPSPPSAPPATAEHTGRAPGAATTGAHAGGGSAATR